MRRDDIMERIKTLEAQLRAEGVAHVALFGSRARGDGREGSDLDVLIDVVPGARFSLLNLSGVGLLIEDATGIPAQIVLRRSAPADFQNRIRADVITVF